MFHYSFFGSSKIVDKMRENTLRLGREGYIDDDRWRWNIAELTTKGQSMDTQFFVFRRGDESDWRNAIFGGTKDVCYRAVKHHVHDVEYVVVASDLSELIDILRVDGICYPLVRRWQSS